MTWKIKFITGFSLCIHNFGVNRNTDECYQWQNLRIIVKNAIFILRTAGKCLFSEFKAEIVFRSLRSGKNLRKLLYELTEYSKKKKTRNLRIDRTDRYKKKKEKLYPWATLRFSFSNLPSRGWGEFGKFPREYDTRANNEQCEKSSVRVFSTTLNCIKINKFT